MADRGSRRRTGMRTRGGADEQPQRDFDDESSEDDAGSNLWAMLFLCIAFRVANALLVRAQDGTYRKNDTRIAEEAPGLGAASLLPK